MISNKLPQDCGDGSCQACQNTKLIDRLSRDRKLLLSALVAALKREPGWIVKCGTVLEKIKHAVVIFLFITLTSGCASQQLGKLERYEVEGKPVLCWTPQQGMGRLVTMVANGAEWIGRRNREADEIRKVARK